MSDILCMYYSRTGNTKTAMEELAAELDAELAELSDGVDRSGGWGYFRSGLDAMRRTTAPLKPIQTERALEDYRLVVLGTPVWAGRCSSVVRGFLKQNGKRLQNTALVLLRGGNGRCEEVYQQMDGYLARPHCAAVSLRAGSVGYHFWQEEFLHRVQALLEEQSAPEPFGFPEF